MTDWTALFEELRACAQASPHPSEKIAARLRHADGRFDPPCHNARPPIIDGLNIPQQTKVADRSLYAHAETRALLLSSRPTKGGTVFVTDPFCPNCAKQIVLAGIKRVVIDGTGFSKPYFIKNEAAFEALSLSIMCWFGVEVCLFENGRTQILEPTESVVSGIEALDEEALLAVRGGLWTKLLSERTLLLHGEGFTQKYDGRIEALHLVLLDATRRGLRPDLVKPVILSHWPSSPRPFVDALMHGITHYVVHEVERPDWADGLTTIGIEVLPV